MIENIREINTLSEDKVNAPPKWIISTYLGLNPPLKINRSEIVEGLENENRIDQFLRAASEFYMIKKLDRGTYFAVDPCTSIICWAIDEYYSELLVLDSLLDHLGVDHSFLCLSGHVHADYVPDRPSVVTKEELGYQALDGFVYEFSSTEKIYIEAMKSRFEVPLLSEEETALLFLSTYLSREVKAGKEILEGLEMSSDMKNKLLSLGYSGYGGDISMSVEIKLPDWVKKKQEEVGLSRLKEVATR